MDRVKVTEAHKAPDRPPLKVQPGDRLGTGERDKEWPAFRRCMRADGVWGWVPDRHLRHESQGEAVVIHAYDTTELSAAVGDVLTVVELDAEGEWLWCVDEAGREGWVPVSVVSEKL